MEKHYLIFNTLEIISDIMVKTRHQSGIIGPPCELPNVGGIPVTKNVLVAIEKE